MLTVREARNANILQLTLCSYRPRPHNLWWYRQFESQLLVNQDLLFKQLCGAEVQGLPHAPVGGGAKKYIEGLKSPGRSKQHRRVAM